MALVDQYREARRTEDVTRLRRALALRAMVESGMSQRQIAVALGVSQPAVSQQLAAAPRLDDVHPEVLVEAAAPILKTVAAEHGYSSLSVFGSVARGQARLDSDIDLLVEAPAGTSTFGFIRFTQLLERILGREIDLVDFGGLRPGLDDDIRREAVPL
jgi:predicted nucleotidyltransferase